MLIPLKAWKEIGEKFAFPELFTRTIAAPLSLFLIRIYRTHALHPPSHHTPHTHNKSCAYFFLAYSSQVFNCLSFLWFIFTSLSTSLFRMFLTFCLFFTTHFPLPFFLNQSDFSTSLCRRLNQDEPFSPIEFAAHSKI